MFFSSDLSFTPLVQLQQKNIWSPALIPVVNSKEKSGAIQSSDEYLRDLEEIGISPLQRANS
jgi:hypothetical protein